VAAFRFLPGFARNSLCDTLYFHVIWDGFSPSHEHSLRGDWLNQTARLGFGCSAAPQNGSWDSRWDAVVCSQETWPWKYVEIHLRSFEEYIFLFSNMDLDIQTL
jgi:hypothetical protein